MSVRSAWRAHSAQSILLRFLIAIALECTSAAAFAQGDFTLIALPDTQNEAQYYPTVLDTEMNWIVANRSALNIQGVVGLGDIVNNGSDDTQQANADAAYRVLDKAGIPYFAAIGNHDYDNENPKLRTTAGFDKWFGPARYSGYPWYLGSYPAGSNANFYGVLNINNLNYLILALEFIPRDAAVTWAQGILQNNQDKEAILITHSFLFVDGTRVDQCDTQDLNRDNYGDKLWSKLVSQYANISLILNGHLTAGNAAHRQDIGVNGNQVTQIFSNYQTLANGGDGWLRIMTFHPSTDTIDVKTYSPYLNAYRTDATNQFTVPWHRPATPATTGTISGLVRNVSGCKAVPGITVSSGGASATTDAKGHYSLTLPAASYTVNASGSGWQSASTTAVVNNGYDADTNFFLTQVSTPPCTLNSTSPSVTICTPANNATVTSPVNVVAGTTDSNAITLMQLYVDGVSKYTAQAGTLNTSISLAFGTHRLTVQAKDSAGALFKQTIDVTVSISGGGSCTASSVSLSVTICAPANNSMVTSPMR